MLLKILKSRGVAVFAPLSSCTPRAEKFPHHIPTVKWRLYPMLHASLLPYEVPVFHAIFGRWVVLCQLNGKSGRFTLERISLIIKVEDALRTRCGLGERSVC